MYLYTLTWYYVTKVSWIGRCIPLAVQREHLCGLLKMQIEYLCIDLNLAVL